MKNSFTILSIIKKQDLENAQKIFNKIIDKYCKSATEDALKIGTPKHLFEQYMFALKVPREKSIRVIKELTYEGVSIVKNESFIKAAVNEAMSELQSEQIKIMQRLKNEESLKQKLRKKGDYSIEELVLLKDWQLMLEVALQQSHANIEKSRKIKELLPDVLNEAIESEVQRDTKSLEIAKSSIERLILIAENETLKRFHLLSVIRNAGEAVIDMCCLHPKELIVELIFLANSRSTIPIINIKAFLAFYNVVSKDTEKYENEILEAARYLNTWALNTVYIASIKLNPDEKKVFDMGIEFFKEKRNSLL